MSLLALIKQRIREHGPISIAEYMALALAHPEYGYYMKRDPLGSAGDFTTAPEISQIFGELIGLWLATQWLNMDKPQAALVELGPGRGTLMQDALRATARVSGFHAAISVHLVETSPALRRKQEVALDGRHPRLHWHESIEALPQLPLLLIANEFFDALPIRQFMGTQQGWRERMVGLDEHGQLVFVIPAKSTIRAGIHPSAFEYVDKWIPACAGMTREYNEAALCITAQLSHHLTQHGGAALIIDYGYIHGSNGDSLQALRDHRYHHPLHDPGSADITAHVDFKALKDAAHATGAATYGPLPQAAFLSALGAAARTQKLCENASDAQKTAMLSALQRLVSPEQMGEMFKVLCLTHPAHPAPEGFPPC